jgi:prepilin-type processing-associated H-X9-DG protein
MMLTLHHLPIKFRVTRWKPPIVLHSAFPSRHPRGVSKRCRSSQSRIGVSPQLPLGDSTRLHSLGCCRGGNKPRRFGAFTFIELLIIVSCVAVLAAIILPALARSTHCTYRINCVNNLKQIGLSYRTWALDNGDKYPMQVSVTNGGAMELVSTGSVFSVFQVMSNELSTPKLLICPDEENPLRTPANTFSSPVSFPNAILLTNDLQVSYFVGLDAETTFPQRLISGDCNLAINGTPVPHEVQLIATNSRVSWVKPRHKGMGNLGLADGSVIQSTSKQLTSVFTCTGISTNRIALP